MDRRRFLTLAGVTAGSAILAACGGSSTATDTPKPSAPTTAAPTTAAPAAAQVSPTAATGSAAAATRPAGSAVASSAASATVPAATASSTTAVGSAAAATRPTGSAVASSGSATAASGSAAAGTTGGIQTMVIEAFDYGFKTLGSIPGGLTRVQMKNTGKELHHAQFMLLNTGVTPDQLGAAFAKGPDAAFGLVTLHGGAGTIAPGGSTEVILNLNEGQYMIVCFIAGDDHIPHLAKRMLMPLKVTAAPATAASAPAVNGTITMFDFNFTMPDTIPAGKSMYTVTNTGAQFHEFNIGQLAPGKTLADAKAFFDPAPNTPPPAGPPPVAPVGGMNALSKGNSGIVVLDLKPGDYVAVCNVPGQSKPNGDSHVHLGMIKAFTVK